MNLADNGTLLAIVAGLGLALGAVWGQWALRRRLEGQFRRQTSELVQTHEAELNRISAVQTRALAELDQLRKLSKQQVATAATATKTATSQVEERLRTAFDEIERLNAMIHQRQGPHSVHNDGFAATQPMTEGL